MQLWVASLLFYCFVHLICCLARLVVENFLERKHGNRFYTTLLLELIGTVQICAPMFDVGTILEHYGLFGVFVEITLLEFVNIYLFRDALVHPCLLVHPDHYKTHGYTRIASIFCAQIIGAYLSAFVARLFWWLQVHSQHTHLLTETNCSTDLTVSLLAGCFIEGIAAFTTKTVEHLASTKYSAYEILVNCTFAGIATVIGINFTGMYAHPIVASACTFNCEGLSHIGHFSVYWLGPLIGWYLAEYYCDRIGAHQFDQNDDDDNNDNNNNNNNERVIKEKVQ